MISLDLFFTSGAALLATGLGIGNLANVRMLSAVNEKLEPQNRISPYWWYWSKLVRVSRLHKRLYPDSPLRKVEVSGFLIALVGFLGVATAILSGGTPSTR